MSSRFPSVFGRNDHHDEEDYRSRRPPPSSFTVSCLITISGQQEEIPGTIAVNHNNLVITAQAGYPGFSFPPTAGTFFSDPDGFLRLVTRAVTVRSKDPAWLNWYQSGMNQSSTVETWNDDHREDRRRQSDSSGFMAIAGHGKEIVSIFKRFKTWQIVLIGIIVALFAIVLVAGVILLLYWILGQGKDQRPTIEKSIKNAIEKNK
jgi:hypothetical protein